MEYELDGYRNNSRNLSIAEFIVSAIIRAIPIKHGKHRLLDIVAPKVWNKTGKQIRLTFNGRELYIDPHDLVGWHFAMLKSFDPEVIEVLSKACAPDEKEILWDIGANKAVCACSLAAKLPTLNVVAIEPQSQLSANNTSNLKSICQNRFEYVQAGLGEEEADLDLLIPSKNLGKASLHLQPTSTSDIVERIKVKTASQIVENSKFGWPTIVKIDVEGHEAPVFRTLEYCIKNKICKLIVFENHAREKEAFDEIRSITEPYGYQVYAINKSLWKTSLILTKKQLVGVTDYVVIRQDLTKENKRLIKLFK